MTEPFTYRQIEKDMASMRREVMIWKKQSDNDELQKYAKTFAQTYKIARDILRTPDTSENFPVIPKRKKIETYYSELQGWHTGVKTIYLNPSEMKKETEIKRTETGKNQEMKKEMEIKQNAKRGRKKKKETEIKGEQMKLNLRGGKREGAGRKSIGLKKPVSITLPEESWNEIDSLIQNGKYKSYADFFRSLYEEK